jgi:hypothetical protein
MVELIVTDGDGRVVGRVVYNEDLFWEYVRRVGASPDRGTRWGVRIFEALFAPTGVGGTTTFTAVDTTGTSRTQNIKVSMGSGVSSFLNTYYCVNRLWVSYGTGTAPPTPDDYKLASKVAEGLAGVTGDDLQGTVTISASFTMTQDTTIYEVGLEWEGAVAGASTCGRFLIDRTVFPEGLTVRAGQTLTVIYRFVL